MLTCQAGQAGWTSVPNLPVAGQQTWPSGSAASPPRVFRAFFLKFCCCFGTEARRSSFASQSPESRQLISRLSYNFIIFVERKKERKKERRKAKQSKAKERKENDFHLRHMIQTKAKTGKCTAFFFFSFSFSFFFPLQPTENFQDASSISSNQTLKATGRKLGFPGTSASEEDPLGSPSSLPSSLASGYE